jgi:hypothetical protein
MVLPRLGQKSGSLVNILTKFSTPTKRMGVNKFQSAKARKKELRIGMILKTVKPSRLGTRKMSTYFKGVFLIIWVSCFLRGTLGPFHPACGSGRL